MRNDELQKYHFLNYDLGEDFVHNSFGFCIEKDKKVLSACTPCLLSKKSAEISIITNSNFRKKGLAALVAAKFILYCLDHDLTPHWDAANYPSYLLAQKLGYKFIGEYKIYYLK
ncbi:GNAT family N-acetyltransferase [Clostridium sp. Sa3CVN1]|uniref:GNAT family N-acetyltransferase n=2 Tax=Clostridium cibarium TaxID=2762247 RepID=A0ABR8PWG2_9CLOT|nr:GNAT family N-acetyltransferase [Clostridium cibarium]